MSKGHWDRIIHTRDGGAGRRSFCSNYDKVFSKCEAHPRYTAQRPPRADCVVCRRLYREAKRNKHATKE